MSFDLDPVETVTIAQAQRRWLELVDRAGNGEVFKLVTESGSACLLVSAAQYQAIMINARDQVAELRERVAGIPVVKEKPQ